MTLKNSLLDLAQQDKMSDPNWWRQAAVYQIYPRSFADSNGDGIGDLPGITSRVPYLKSLGIDAVWLSPFYPSALADGGYDVDDYRNVDPKLGTLQDFDDMTAALHDAGIKLIVDIVPNHTSNQHEWFKEALATPQGSSARDRYIFHDGKGPDGAEPPSDWRSVFGGSAWERVPDGQWYLHLFAPEQPDLNWDNQDVREDFLKTLRFWSDRGADGFRIDVAHGVAKDVTSPMAAWSELGQMGDLLEGNHPFWDREEVHEIYTQWRKVFNEYQPPRSAVAEAMVHPTQRPKYASPEGLGQAFNFDLLEAAWDPEEYRRIITENLSLAQESGASSTWVLSNHDVIRHATRYGITRQHSESPAQAGRNWLLKGGPDAEVDRAVGLQRAKAATLLMLALPGSAYMYQGEELGLHEVADIPDEARQDPVFRRNTGVDVGRDGCRVPLPWTTTGTSYGFGPGNSHLPQPHWFGELSVQHQDRQNDSTLALYRNALELRHQLQINEELHWVSSPAEVLHFTRHDGWQSITNFSSQPVTLPDAVLALSSGPVKNGMLPPDTTAWLI